MDDLSFDRGPSLSTIQSANSDAPIKSEHTHKKRVTSDESLKAKLAKFRPSTPLASDSPSLSRSKVKLPDTDSKLSPEAKKAFQELRRLSEKDIESPKMKRLINASQNVFNRQTHENEKDSRWDEVLFNQEHLGALAHQGSQTYRQKLLFKEALIFKDKESFTKIHEEIDHMVPFETEQIRWNQSPEAQNKMIGVMVRRLKALSEGKSMWMDLSTQTHTMMARITREKDGFTMQFANTGDGVVENRDFHPVMIHSQSGKRLFQTVTKLENIPVEKFCNTDFMKGLYRVRMESSLSHSGKSEAEARPTNRLYAHLRSLGVTPTAVPHSKDAEAGLGAVDDRYWSHLQRGGSCVPSSMWMLAKVGLSREAFKELRLETRLNFLIKTYRLIASGWDSTMTSKIIALELVQKVQGVIKKDHEFAVPKELKVMREKLLRMTPNGAESPIDATERPRKIPNVVHIEEVDFEVKDSASLRLKATFRPINAVLAPIVYDMEKEGLSSKAIEDMAYMLYYNVASGKAKESSQYLEQCIDMVKDIHRSPRSERRHIQNAIRLQEVSALLGKLSMKLRQVDHTRAGLAKQYTLALLGLYMAKKGGVPSTEAQRIVDSFKDKVTQWNLELYLEDDNIWLKGYQKLERFLG